jgi:hypothetical protein
MKAIDLPSITHFASSHETSSAAEATAATQSRFTARMVRQRRGRRRAISRCRDLIDLRQLTDARRFRGLLEAFLDPFVRCLERVEVARTAIPE